MIQNTAKVSQTMKVYLLSQCLSSRDAEMCTKMHLLHLWKTDTETAGELSSTVTLLQYKKKMLIKSARLV